MCGCVVGGGTRPFGGSPERDREERNCGPRPRGMYVFVATLDTVVVLQSKKRALRVRLLKANYSVFASCSENRT